MPNRIIRDGLLDSEKVMQLSSEEERFFVRLLLVVDDYGRFDARSILLKSKCFPMNEKIKSDMVKKWLKKLHEVGLLRYYSVEGKEYLEIVEFNQRLRQKKEKYPGPELSDGSNVLTLDSNMPLEEKRRELEEKKKRKVNVVVNTKDVAWKRSTQISTAGSDDEYLQRVDWWYEEAKQDEDWKKNMKNLYPKINYSQAFEGMRQWLLKLQKNRRNDLNTLFRNFCKDKYKDFGTSQKENEKQQGVKRYGGLALP